MILKFLDKKYTPLYLLVLGIGVFMSAFFYASKMSGPVEPADEENQLTSANSESDDLKVDPTDSPIASESPTLTLKPTKAIVTATITPTTIITITPTLTPTAVPTLTITPSPEPIITQTTTTITPSISPTATITPTP